MKNNIRKGFIVAVFVTLILIFVFVENYVKILDFPYSTSLYLLSKAKFCAKI